MEIGASGLRSARRKAVGGDLVMEVTGAVAVAVGNEGSDGQRIIQGELPG